MIQFIKAIYKVNLIQVWLKRPLVTTKPKVLSMIEKIDLGYPYLNEINLINSFNKLYHLRAVTFKQKYS
jgi:hypothetical protein